MNSITTTPPHRLPEATPQSGGPKARRSTPESSKSSGLHTSPNIQQAGSQDIRIESPGPSSAARRSVNEDERLRMNGWRARGCVTPERKELSAYTARTGLESASAISGQVFDGPEMVTRCFQDLSLTSGLDQPTHPEDVYPTHTPLQLSAPHSSSHADPGCSPFNPTVTDLEGLDTDPSNSGLCSATNAGSASPDGRPEVLIQHEQDSVPSYSSVLFTVAADGIQETTPHTRSVPGDRESDAIAPAASQKASSATQHVDGDQDGIRHCSEWRSSCEEDSGMSDLMRPSPSDTTVALPISPAAMSVSAEPRGDLERSRCDIETPDDSLGNASGVSESDSELSFNTSQMPQTSNEQGHHAGMKDTQEATGDNYGEHHGSRMDSVTSQEIGASGAFDKGQSNKRLRPDDTSEDNTLAEVGLKDKRTRNPQQRFVCCYHNGPGRKCSGTDENIYDVIKNLSLRHDIHVCGRCYALKEVDDNNGLIHGLTCPDMCLSPQCYSAPPTVGHRHVFNQQSCESMTSKVRPADSEATFRFIYELVHPTLRASAEVYTSSWSSHLGKERKKVDREKLTARVNELEKKLRESDKQNVASVALIEQLTRELTTETAKTRKIIAMLSDALRTGTFSDRDGYLSLLERVKQDAPDALSNETPPFSTPPTPNDSHRSSTTPNQDEAGMLG